VVCENFPSTSVLQSFYAIYRGFHTRKLRQQPRQH
jgi:hypothetical protein